MLHTGEKDGTDKVQAFQFDSTATFNSLHVPPRCPSGV